MRVSRSRPGDAGRVARRVRLVTGVALHVVDMGGNAVDTTSAVGRFMLVILAGAAEMERNLVRERTRSALAIKRSNGQRVGSLLYGYDLASDGST